MQQCNSRNARILMLLENVTMSTHLTCSEYCGLPDVIFNDVLIFHLSVCNLQSSLISFEVRTGVPRDKQPDKLPNLVLLMRIKTNRWRVFLCRFFLSRFFISRFLDALASLDFKLSLSKYYLKSVSDTFSDMQ